MFVIENDLHNIYSIRIIEEYYDMFLANFRTFSNRSLFAAVRTHSLFFSQHAKIHQREILTGCALLSVYGGKRYDPEKFKKYDREEFELSINKRNNNEL